MKPILLFQVWHDGYDGSDVTHSYWFSKERAHEIVARLNRDDPQERFPWLVIAHKIEDTP